MGAPDTERPISRAFRGIPIGLVVVVCAAVLIRLTHLWAFYSNSPFAAILISDAHLFEAWGARIADGDWLGEPRLFVLPPLYPYLVGFIYTLVGRHPESLVVLQSLLGVAASGLVWRLAYRRFGSVAGLAAGLLYACSGSVLFYESMLVGTSLSVFLMLLTITFLDGYRVQRSLRDLIAAGLGLGLLTILRPNFLLVFPVFLLIAVWEDRYGGFRALKQPVLVCTLAVASPLLVLLLRNGIAAGEWTPLTAHGGINFYMGNHAGAPGWFSPPPGMASHITPQEPEGNLTGPRRLAERETGRTMTDREVSAFWLDKGISYFVEDPLQAAGGLLRKSRLFMSGFEVPLNYSYEYHRRYAAALNIQVGQMWFLLPLAMIGAALAVRRGSRWDDLSLLFVSYAASVILFHVSTRYRMPVVPILCVFGGIAAQAFVDLLHSRQWSRAAAGVSCFALLLTGFVLERSSWDASKTRSMDPYNLGTAYLYAGRPDLALPNLEEASSSGGLYPSLFYNLGLAYSSVGRDHDAATAYERAIELEPEMSAAFTNLGNIHFKSNRFGEAETAYRRATSVDPNAHNARAALGWVHFTYHRNDSARAAWEQVLARDPLNASAAAGIRRLNSLE